MSPWDFPCLRSVRGEWFYLRADSSGAAALTLAGRLVGHTRTSGTTHEDYSSGYAIHSDKTNPKQAITCRKSWPLRFHHPNRRLGTAHKSRF